jgi:hypothetical protein
VKTGTPTADAGRTTGTTDAAAPTTPRPPPTNPAGAEATEPISGTAREGTTTGAAGTLSTATGAAGAGAGANATPAPGFTRTGLADEGLPTEAAAPGRNEPDPTPASTPASGLEEPRVPRVPRPGPAASEPPAAPTR